MSTSDESLWTMYAVAAVTAGHRSAAAIDEIATEALALHRRRFSGADAPPEPHAYPSAASTTSSDRPAKGKDSR